MTWLYIHKPQYLQWNVCLLSILHRVVGVVGCKGQTKWVEWKRKPTDAYKPLNNIHQKCIDLTHTKASFCWIQLIRCAYELLIDAYTPCLHTIFACTRFSAACMPGWLWCSHSCQWKRLPSQYQHTSRTLLHPLHIRMLVGWIFTGYHCMIRLIGVQSSDRDGLVQ